MSITTSNNVNKLDPVILSIIRRVMPSILAQQVISVQPLSTSIFDMRQYVMPTLIQLDEITYTGYFSNDTEITNWLMFDCVWEFCLWTDNKIDQKSYSYPSSILIFANLKGSIEFKLRWIDV